MRCKPPARLPKDLTRTQLEDIVGRIQELLWYDFYPDANQTEWDQDFAWDYHTDLGEVANYLRAYDLEPEEEE